MKGQIRHFYDFGRFRVDAEDRVLLRDGEPVPLTPKVFETLRVLVENSGRLVEKDKLMGMVWPDRFVEEANLTQNISLLRKALGDNPDDNQYIETVPRRGYRFVANVRSVLGESGQLIVQQHLKSQIIIEEQSEQNREGEPARYIESSAVHRLRISPTRVSQPNVGRLTSIADCLRGEVKHLRRAPILIAATIVASLGIAAGVRFLGRGRTRSAPPFQVMKMTALITRSNVIDAAISPDGKYFAYVLEEAGRQSLCLRQIDATNSIEVIAPAEVSYQSATFSRDGTYIYYVVLGKDKLEKELYQVAALGGYPRKLITGIDSGITLSPENDRLAFVRASHGVYKLIVTNSDGTEEKTLATRSLPELFFKPAWSPDGKLIACSAGIMADSDNYMNVTAVSVADGTEVLLTPERWAYVGQVAWLSDGSGLVIRARNHEHTRSQLWRLEYPSGIAERITNDLNDYQSVSLAADSSTLVSVQRRSLAGVWVAPEGSPIHSRLLPFEAGDYDNITDVAWTPDGRIIFSANTAGKWDLWIVDLEGRPPRQLTFDGSHNGAPSVSADGRYVFYCSSRTGTSQIWRIDVDGGNPMQLTKAGGLQPNCLPDGRWVVYVAISPLGKYSLWKVSSDGGEPAKLSDASFGVPSVSPDGRLIAGIYSDERPDSTFRLAVMRVEGGNPITTFDFQANASSKNSQLRFLQWMPGGRAISYINSRNGESSIWSQPVDGGPPSPIADFGTDVTFSHAWSPVGQLAYTRASQLSQVVLINDLSRR